MVEVAELMRVGLLAPDVAAGASCTASSTHRPLAVLARRIVEAGMDMGDLRATRASTEVDRRRARDEARMLRSRLAPVATAASRPMWPSLAPGSVGRS